MNNNIINILENREENKKRLKFLKEIKNNKEFYFKEIKLKHKNFNNLYINLCLNYFQKENLYVLNIKCVNNSFKKDFTDFKYLEEYILNIEDKL